jgi:putative nucleotidyltransferase with HDIG domain
MKTGVGSSLFWRTGFLLPAESYGLRMLLRSPRALVLVVEPDAATRATMQAMLRTCGFAAAGVASGAKALEYLAGHEHCHLVLSEATLPGGMSGFLLLDAVARDHANVGVVLCMQRTNVQLAVQAFRRGAADVLLKPVTLPTLKHAAESALLQGRMRGEMLRYLHSLEQLVNERTGKLRELMTDLERSYDVTIEAMGDALDMRDEETEGHSKRVTAYTVALARAMHLEVADLKTIARGAFLHDIGKIAIPDSILLKPGPLTPEEMDVMQSHCEHGYRIVRKIPFLADAAEIVLSHQERFDGTGYPRGLRGEHIPLGARIFAIADSLDAITSDRPYRKGSSFADAMREIARCSGDQFDPRIVEAFQAMPHSTWPSIRAEIGRHSHAGELVRAAAA